MTTRAGRIVRPDLFYLNKGAQSATIVRQLYKEQSDYEKQVLLGWKYTASSPDSTSKGLMKKEAEAAILNLDLNVWL